MALEVATHNGPFHADDVLAFAMIRAFWDAAATVVRSRDPERLDRAAVVIDVGGRFEPPAGRFDHHQATYTGDRSSAGMILDWLEETGRVDRGLASSLREQLVDYVDAVDNGRVTPKPGVPCFAKMVDAYNRGLEAPEAFDAAYLRAVEMAQEVVEGLARGYRAAQEAERDVVAAMEAAVAEGRRTLYLDRPMDWKPAYFQHGGEEHPTDYTLMPGTDGSWRVIAIPPRFGDFAQKRPLPADWAGLVDQELARVTGEPEAVFCHKNRFIAVFKTRQAALRTLERHGLL